MATTKHVVKKVRNEAKVLVAADAVGTVTVTLAELALNDEHVDSPLVNISGVEGTADAKITIHRGASPVFACGAGSWGQLDLYNLDLNNETDIVVAFAGSGSLVLTLNKVSGYGFVGINGPTGPQPE